MITICSRVSRLRVYALFLVAAVLAFVARLPAADTARRGATETALDRYVAKPDAAFAWTKAATTPEEGATSFTLDLVSQHWLTTAEVDRPEWRHWVTIARPDNLAHSTSLLMIGGGANAPGAPPKISRTLLEIARSTKSVVAELRMVPNQPLVFGGDGQPRGSD